MAVRASSNSLGGTIDVDDDILFATGTGPDTDGDGFSDGIGCAPLDASTYPGAPEANDGQDNQCPGDPGFGIVDEISGSILFASGSFCWTMQPLATNYEVAKSGTSDFSSTCTIVNTTANCFSDPSPPAVGKVEYYLVRAVSPNVGSWGTDASGSERTVSSLSDSNCDDIPGP
ncbi:MAG: hypothetical protein ACE5HD_00410 [Acidobacteriota bacterium]